MTAHTIAEKFDDFSREMNDILHENELKRIEYVIEKTTVSEDERFNQKVREENLHLL